MQGQYYRLLYHAVWATRCRESLLDPELRAAIHRYLKGKVREYGGTPLAVGGIADHVHLIFSVPPQAPLCGRHRQAQRRKLPLGESCLQAGRRFRLAERLRGFLHLRGRSPRCLCLR